VDVHFVVPELRRLDELKSEAICAGFFSDERPLRGALGLIDWRLLGGVSRRIREGRLGGAWGERALLGVRAKLPFDKLFLFGLGPREAFDEKAFRAACTDMFATLERAKVRASVCVLPGRALGLIAPDRAMEIVLGVVAAHPEQDEVTLVEDAEAQREMTPIVERERRRARAQV
jgi:hypothetical protein